MSRSRRRSRTARESGPRPPQRPPQRPQKHRIRRAPVAIGLAAIASIALVAIALRWMRDHQREVSARANPAQALSAGAAYREAVRLAGNDRPEESLPYFRRAIEGLNPDNWEVHYSYGLTLSSNAMRYITRAGQPALAARSSVVRVGLVREALNQLDRAARIAPDRKTRAQALGRFANTCSVWGFPWETLDLMRRAEDADTTDPEAATRAFLYMKMMRDPPLYAGDISVKQALELEPRAAPPPRRRSAP